MILRVPHRILHGRLGQGPLVQRQQDDLSVIQHLQIEPQLLQAAAFLGELLYRQGDLELAIKTYERALPIAPPSVAVGMRGRLAAWREEASLPQNRDAIRDDRFTISFDGPVQQKLAARATSVLSAAFWRIGKTLGAYPSAPINVIPSTWRGEAPRRRSRTGIASALIVDWTGGTPEASFSTATILRTWPEANLLRSGSSEAAPLFHRVPAEAGTHEATA